MLTTSLTHVAQPLDFSFFRPLKVYWYEACHKYVQDNPGRVITKYQFSHLFSQAWYKAIHPENVIAGFVKAGVCPFNAEAIKIRTLPRRVSEDEQTMLTLVRSKKAMTSILLCTVKKLLEHTSQLSYLNFSSKGTKMVTICTLMPTTLPG